jgi:hypothetical protein
MKEIILTVDMDGRSKIETKGFKGKACLQASKFLEDALGKTIEGILKPEYYEFDGSRVNNKSTANAK